MKKFWSLFVMSIMIFGLNGLDVKASSIEYDKSWGGQHEDANLFRTPVALTKDDSGKF